MRRFILALLLSVAALPACKDSGTTFTFDAGSSSDAPKSDAGGADSAGSSDATPDGAIGDGATADGAGDVTLSAEEKR
jgi:hypothetical protein